LAGVLPIEEVLQTGGDLKAATMPGNDS
jgi:hypothetical protein